MKNGLADLNNVLFEQLDILTDDSLSEEELQKQIQKSKTVCDIAQQIIDISQVQLSAIKVMEEFGINNKQMPALLTIKDNKEEINYR